MKNIGISFGDIHSYYDLELILSKVDIPPAIPKTTYVDIPGGDGSIDLSEAQGEIRYKDRELKFTFTVKPSIDSTFEDKKSEVSNCINGKVFRITLDKDSDYYYYGRCTVSSYTENKNILQIVISATAKPYKFRQNKTTVSFLLYGEEKAINLLNGRKSVAPYITVSDNDTEIVFDGYRYTLDKGVYHIPDIRLKQGNNHMILSGTGNVKFEYQEADL